MAACNLGHRFQSIFQESSPVNRTSEINNMSNSSNNFCAIILLRIRYPNRSIPRDSGGCGGSIGYKKCPIARTLTLQLKKVHVNPITNNSPGKYCPKAHFSGGDYNFLPYRSLFLDPFFWSKMRANDLGPPRKTQKNLFQLGKRWRQDLSKTWYPSQFNHSDDSKPQHLFFLFRV